MPQFTVEVDDKGDFVGTLPAEVDAIIKRIEITANGMGQRAGMQKASETAKVDLDSALKAERAKFEAQMPLEREKWQTVEEENKALKTQMTDSMRESSRQAAKREEAHAEEITKRADAINRRNARIQALVAANLKALAAQNGARDESLGELEVILQHRIGFDDDMEPYVKDETGERFLQHGKPVSIDAFVKTYLDNHPHHRKPTPGRGGDARRGASLTGGGTNTTVDGARARIEQGDRSAGAINDLFLAGRKQAS